MRVMFLPVSKPILCWQGSRSFLFPNLTSNTGAKWFARVISNPLVTKLQCIFIICARKDPEMSLWLGNCLGEARILSHNKYMKKG